MKSCRTEPVSPRSLLPLLAEASLPVHLTADVRNNLAAGGAPSAAGCSGKLAWRMICTMTSPLNHCLSPVPGLLFPTWGKKQLQEAKIEKSPL